MNRIFALILLFLLTLLIAAQTPTSISSKHQFIESKLKDEELMKMAMGKEMSLPQMRVYEKQGQLVIDFGNGFDEDTFKEQLDKVLQSPKPIAGKRTLKSELSIMVDSKNKALKDLPAADFTIVEYWADWCEPCHMQFDLLKQALKEHETLAINVLHVQADPTKLPGMKVENQK